MAFYMNELSLYAPNQLTKITALTDDIAKALALPDKEASWHPLNIPVERLDPNFTYCWKAYAINEKAIFDMDNAQGQIVDNLKQSIAYGWRPVYAMHYPFLLTPSIRKYSTGQYIRYNGLILCCIPKPLKLPCYAIVSSWEKAQRIKDLWLESIEEQVYISDGGINSLGIILQIDLVG